MNLLIKILSNEHGILPAIAGGLASGALGGLFGLLGSSPRGAKEAQSMSRRAARQETGDIGMARSLREMLLPRAAQAAFGVNPIDFQIQALRQKAAGLSGKAHRGVMEEIAALMAQKAGTAGPRSQAAEGFLPSGGAGAAFTAEELGPFRTRLLPSEREALEGQFGQAREAVLAGPRGGFQERGLSDVALERARSISGAEIDAAEKGRRLALSLLTPAAFSEEASPSLAGVLSSTQAQEAATQKSIQGLGQGLGGILQGILGKGGSPPVQESPVGRGSPIVDQSSVLRRLLLHRPERLSI